MEFRPYYLAREWLKLGHRVRIVAASESHLRHQQPNVDGNIAHESIDEIEYVWLKTPSYHGNGVGRVLNLLAFAKALFLYRKSLLSDFIPDIVIASSPHPFIIRGSKKIASHAKASLVFEVRDLWPLSLVELGGMSRWHPFVMLMQYEENYAYQCSDKIASLLPKAQEYMCSHGMSKEKFIYTPNGIVVADWKTSRSLPNETAGKIDLFRSKHDFLVGFTGTHGVANALSYLLEAAKLLKSDNVGFVLVGEGIVKNALIKYAQKNKLSNVLFLNPVEKRMIPSFLTRMDILYIGWKKQPLYRFGVSPNKLFDYMMAGKPIVHAIDAGNDLVAESGCGISCEAENPEAIAKVIMKLKDLSEDNSEAMGAKGRDYVLANHDYAVLAKKYLGAMP
ncbi:glycosyltransferase [Candidatus Thiomargarita nelsonii]|uniref:Glycosyltransferase n=1 Tax=Candidatus Thiomargarita nelsonii TaxID=1003181 RepID=A0A176S1U3_9GAMM|nr:glycosyltransferase [Candidatus Thiomargarita nelsonii]